MKYEEFFEKAQKKDIVNIQITEKETISSGVEIINGKIENYEDYDSIKYSIKAEYHDKTVKLVTDYLDSEILDLIIFKAENTDSKYSDEYLEKTSNIEKENPKEFTINDEITKLKKLDEEYRQKYSEVSKLTVFFDETSENTRIINNNGVDISTMSHLCTFITEVLVGDSEDAISYDEKQISPLKEKIDFQKIIEDTIKKALILKNQTKMKTNKYDIILDSPVASRIISNLAFMLSAANIRNKTSCLNEKIGNKEFSELLTIIEDPTNRDYPGYRLFDDEGTKTYRKEIINNGEIKTYLYNIKEAKISNKKSTANGYQGISTKNMYVIPGKKSQKELIEEMKDGILITDYMGASGTSVNISNGNISLQIFGFLIKDGKIVSGIVPSVMTTSIFELLSNIKEVGNDLLFTMTSSASPSILIKDISIAS